MSRRLAPLLIALVGLAACARLLGIKEPGPHLFEHRAHVLKGVACVRCHQGIDKAGDVGPLHLPDTATCLGCHAKPHDRRDCGSCHGEAQSRELAAQARHYVRFRHDAHLPRAKGNCVRCHVDVARTDSTLRPAMATCFTCHAHQDQQQASDCNRCHVDLEDQGLRPQSHLIHDGDWLREHGVRAAADSATCASCHSQTYCASCHGQTVPALRERLAFDKTLAGGIHRAGFASRHSEEARSQPGLCLTCHSEDSCRSCHDRELVSPSSDGARSPHPRGWLGLPGERNEHGRAAWRNPAECASCHGGAGEALCVGCHQVGGIGGNPHAPGWTSQLSRGTDLPCRLCHPGGR